MCIHTHYTSAVPPTMQLPTIPHYIRFLIFGSCTLQINLTHSSRYTNTVYISVSVFCEDVV